MPDVDQMLTLSRQGFTCGQILLILGLELQGKTNPDLVRSVHGLAGGLGFTGEACGALTGSACLLGLYAGRGQISEPDDPRLMFMVQDLVNWFRQEIASKYGGLRCDEILQGDHRNMQTRCPTIVAACFQKSKDLLVENGFDLSGLDE